MGRTAIFFGLSSGRSGSKTLAKTLSQSPDCACLHHPSPQLILEATEYYCGEFSEDVLANVLRLTRPIRDDVRHCGEVNLQLSLIVPLLKEVFPDCKFVWLTRDGRGAVASMYYRGWYRPREVSNLGIWDAARLQGDRTHDFSATAWSRLEPFERCCWIWKKYNSVIEEELSLLSGDRWMRVTLEKLDTSIASLASFLRITPPDQFIVEQSNSRLQPVIAWQEWSTRHRSQFDAICGDDMDRWYPDWRSAEGEWRRVETDRVSSKPTENRNGVIFELRHKAMRGLNKLATWVDPW